MQSTKLDASGPTASDTGEPRDTWRLYVLLCANERLYVGIARDVDARLAAHRSGKGAFYTRLNTPVRILASELHPSRGAALRAEYALKQLPRKQKLAWVASNADAPSGPATRAKK